MSSSIQSESKPAETKPAAPPEAAPPISFERLPGETDRAFAAFLVYRNMGADRSIRKAGRKLSKNYATLNQWSVKNSWTERAAAFDDHAAKAEVEAIEDRARKDAKKWADRLNAHRERRFRLGSLMLRTAEKLLSGKKRPDPAAADRLAKVGDMLIGLSTGAPTSHTAISASEDSGPIPIVASVGTVNVFLPAKKPLPDEPAKA